MDFFWGLEVKAEAEEGDIEAVVVVGGVAGVSFVSTDNAFGILSSDVEADGVTVADLDACFAVFEDGVWSNLGFLARLGPGSSAGGEDDVELTDDSRLFFFLFFVNSL